MRDPKAHAKVLALRWGAVGRAWNLATHRSDFIARTRLMHLHQRVVEVVNLHKGKTGWRYTPPSGRHPGFWDYTEIDTEEAPDA